MIDIEKNITLSIILPVYNVEKYIERCVESILTKNREEIEIIIVDDGATDGSPQICDKYADKVNNIKVIHKQNGGLSSARNAGMDVAQGKYIYFLDSDDWITEDAISKMFRYIEKDDIDVLKFNYYEHKTDSMKVNSSIIPGHYNEESIKKNILPEAICPSNITTSSKVVLSVWSHVYKMDFLKKNNITFVSEREIGSEDFLFNIQVYACASSMQVIEDNLYYYDQRMGSLTQRYRVGLYNQYCKLIALYEEKLKNINLYENYVDRIQRFYIRSMWYVCIQNECKLESKKEVKKNIKEILNNRDLRKALKDTPLSSTDLKGKIYILLMKWKATSLIIALKKKR